MIKIGSLIASINDPEQIPFVVLEMFLEMVKVERLDKNEMEKMSGMTYFMFYDDIHEYRGRNGYNEDITGGCTSDS